MMDMMSNGPGGWMAGGMWFFSIFFWVLVIAGAVFIVRWLMERPTQESPAEESPGDILKRRYAQGEIDREAFERMKQDIGDRGHEK
ncbi:MAG: SHOCT domain-containing protein [Sulfuricaulis sp.]